MSVIVTETNGVKKPNKPVKKPAESTQKKGK